MWHAKMCASVLVWGRAPVYCASCIVADMSLSAPVHVYICICGSCAPLHPCRAPIDPADLVKPDQLRHMDPNDVLIVTTGSQVRVD